MMRNALISKLILTIVVSGFLFAGLPIRAVSALKSETVENEETAGSDDSKVVTGGQVTVQLSRAEVDTIAAALPEGDARRIFKEKLATGAEKDNAASDEVPKEGEEFGNFVFVCYRQPDHPVNPRCEYRPFDCRRRGHRVGHWLRFPDSGERHSVGCVFSD